MQNKDNEQVPNANRDEWNAEELSEQSVNEQPDETLRKVLRGDEDKGNANDRDVTGTSTGNETPQGREETKKRAGAEKNG